MYYRFSFVVVLFLTVGFVAFSGIDADSSGRAAASFEHKAIAGIKLESIDGRTSTLGEYLRRGPVYLNFWALWCDPCKQELRALKPIVKELADEPFTFLAINIDSPKSLAKVRAYVRSQEYPFSVILDPNQQIFHSFNGQHLPFAILIDANGNVIKTRTGYLAGDEKDIKKDILKLLQR